MDEHKSTEMYKTRHCSRNVLLVDFSTLQWKHISKNTDNTNFSLEQTLVLNAINCIVYIVLGSLAKKKIRLKQTLLVGLKGFILMRFHAVTLSAEALGSQFYLLHQTQVLLVIRWLCMQTVRAVLDQCRM